MGESNLHIERRRERRFPLRHPGSVKVGLENAPEISGITENVSGHGVMLHTDSVIRPGTPIEIVITPSLEPAAKPTQLVYRGKVLRSEKLSANKFAIAAECERCVSIRVDDERSPQSPRGEPSN